MKKLVFLLLAVALLGGVGVFSTSLLAGPAGPLYDLAGVPRVRVFEARLSIPLEYHACAETPVPDSGTVPGVRCGDNGDIPPHLAQLTAGRKSLDPDSLQAAALALVLWGDTKESSLNAAIELLEKALALAPDRVSLLVDLSALYLARAQRTGNPRDLVPALNHAREAVALDPRNRNALFNAALAAQAFSLDGVAIAQWDGYLAVERDSSWVREALANRSALLDQPQAPTELPTFSSRAEVGAFAAEHPQEARVFGWDVVLDRWGNATLNDSAARARFHLSIAEQLGAALERQGGDKSLADAVVAIQASQNNPAATLELAQAHQAYACTQTLLRKDLEAARKCSDRLMRLNPRSDVLISATKVVKARMMLSELPPAEVTATVDSLLSDIDVSRHPALAARLNWISGKVLWNKHRYTESRTRSARAAEIYERLGEDEYYGITRAMEGWAWHVAGDTLTAYRTLHQALSALRPYRSSVWLSSVLLDMAKHVGNDGMPSAAAPLLKEAFMVGLRAESPTEMAQALIAIEANTMLTGTPRDAGNLDSADILMTRVRDSVVVNRLTSMRAVIEATSPGELESVVAFFEDDNAVWQMTALMRRADLYLAAKNFEKAGADLDSVTAYFWRTSQSEKNFHNRAAVMEQAKSLFDKLVMLHADARRPVEALRALERGRVSFAPGGDAKNPGGPLMSPQDQVALEYALIRDQLLIWMVRGRTVTLFRRTVDRDTILRAIDQANAALESVNRADDAQPHLRHLHEWLIRPVRDSLPLETPLVIVADGEIAGVPFAALRDAEREQYLIEDHLLRFAATLSEAARTRQFSTTTGRSPLLIADPAFDREVHSTLKPLGGARAEMDSLLRMYPVADTISGTNATVAALVARAPRASVIHYAGHAIFDDTRPERSFLVLAGTGRLSADTVGSMNLRGVRMVVLSACRTLRARQGRSGGFAGLSGALLSAGAGGVVGSLWKVEDMLAKPLMVEFHRAYTRTSDPARALRHAQIQMLRSRDAGRKSPAVWAGFRYVGR
jgi:CHAT domain-containing protein